MSTERIVRVGVAAILRRRVMYAQTGTRAIKILMGKRKGSHGAGKWSFPGGHQEWGETVAKCASRETEEETGFVIPEDAFYKLTFTNDVFSPSEDKHYITLYMAAECPLGEPRLMEPAKCEEWRWWAEPPPEDELFLPIVNLLKDGFYPWRLQD